MPNELLIMPTLTTQLLKGNRFRLTKKFIQGVSTIAEYWPGHVTVLLRGSQHSDDNLDHIDVATEELPFNIEIITSTSFLIGQRLTKARVILATLSRELLWVEKYCNQMAVALIWITETSLATRHQIIDTIPISFLRRLKRKLWELVVEQRYRQIISRSAGVQCNGTPTFFAYRLLNRHAFLFFDGRVSSSMIASPADITPRIERMLNGAPLNLAFSGRLIAMKGVNHLPTLAQELCRRGIPFQFFIFGDGDQRATLYAKIKSLELHEKVQLEGVLDFETQLLPTVKSSIDLFVCCHLQGDPSCTYLETLSCGVPIIGYANEAWAGLQKLSDAGWATPMGDPVKLADKIEAIYFNRPILGEKSLQALNFAFEHSFEKSMKYRVEHLLSCSHL